MKKDFKSSSQFGASTANQLGRLGITLGIISLLLVLSAFPFPFRNLAEIRPAFLLIAVYYWAIFRPQMLSPLGAFGAGLALDLISGWYFGMNAMSLVVVQWIVKSQRRLLLAQNFIVIWVSFALVALLSGILQWAVFCLLEFHLTSIRPVLTGILMTVLIYPLIVLPLFRVNRRLERRSFG